LERRFSCCHVSLVVLIDLSEFLGSRGKTFDGVPELLWCITIEEHGQDKDIWRRNILFHGATTHGSQYIVEARRRRAHDLLRPSNRRWLRHRLFPQTSRLGHCDWPSSGLGTGTLRCLPDAGDSARFMRIIPTVIEMTSQEIGLPYLRRTAAARWRSLKHPFRDARLTLKRDTRPAVPLSDWRIPGGRPPYHVLALDAFSGDSVPATCSPRSARFELLSASLADI